MARYLHSKCGVPESRRRTIISAIFGRDGLLSANSVYGFDDRSLQLSSSYHTTSTEFRHYFDKKLVPRLRDNVLQPQLRNTNIPLRWTNNNCESMNNVIKQVTNWKALKLPTLSDKLHDIVKLQLADMRRALHGQGNFEVTYLAKKYVVTQAAWQSKSNNSKATLFQKFLNHKQQKEQYVSSSDGILKIPKTPTTARKPGHKKWYAVKRPQPTKKPKHWWVWWIIIVPYDWCIYIYIYIYVLFVYIRILLYLYELHNTYKACLKFIIILLTSILNII